MSITEETLLSRKKELEAKLKEFYPLQKELDGINKMLAGLGRGGWESQGCPNGCRCSKCDPSW